MQLDTQALFESLWFGTDTKPVLIWFTAKWCKPCQRMDKAAIEAAAKAAGFAYYICDITVNEYTPGFCGVRAFPTFMVQQPRKVLGKITNSDTSAVCAWIQAVSKTVS